MNRQVLWSHQVDHRVHRFADFDQSFMSTLGLRNVGNSAAGLAGNFNILMPTQPHQWYLHWNHQQNARQHWVRGNNNYTTTSPTINKDYNHKNNIDVPIASYRRAANVSDHSAWASSSKRPPHAAFRSLCCWLQRLVAPEFYFLTLLFDFAHLSQGVLVPLWPVGIDFHGSILRRKKDKCEKKRTFSKIWKMLEKWKR